MENNVQTMTPEEFAAKYLPVLRAREACATQEISKEQLRQELGKAWDDPRMIDYCLNKVSAVAVLANGEIITVSKRSVETHFCFGESGYDYDDALRMARHARTSEDYFREQNMKSFEQKIDELNDAYREDGGCRVAINRIAYIGQASDCRLRSIEIVRMNQIIEACGGSCRMDELPGRELTIMGQTYRIATKQEVERIIDAYKEAAESHRKKVEKYLKRYGLSKVRSWTYWIDA